MSVALKVKPTATPYGRRVSRFVYIGGCEPLSVHDMPRGIFLRYADGSVNPIVTPNHIGPVRNGTAMFLPDN